MTVLSPVPFHRYVALGDSFAEGVGDPHPTASNGLRGWADRVAAVLAQQPGCQGTSATPTSPSAAASSTP